MGGFWGLNKMFHGDQEAEDGGHGLQGGGLFAGDGGIDAVREVASIS